MLPLLALALCQTPDAVKPVDDKGRVLNLGFETGTLADWTADGDAFKDQPIKGDTVKPRRGDSVSNHAGEYWIGGYEKYGDKPTGTLTSAAFPITHPYGSFLVAGGSTKDTRVELLVDGKVILTASATESETLQREVVDLRAHQGKKLTIRLVDNSRSGWGHLNFDDFLFHTAQPPKAPGATDAYPFNGQSPLDAAKTMTVPKDFSVKLFAGEPDVHQPIAFCFDDRGRVWVLEAYVYPKRKPFPGPLLPDAEKKNGDKILIFEDTDGDGTFDKKTVFLEGLNLASGIEIGFGGVWVGAAPYLMFIPDADRNDKPDGPPQILLDGWGMQDTHETLNSFLWGPDGWLYGCHGVFTHSRVGKPGTPDADRTPINAGVWRYHPTKHVFDVFAHGTSNPWGLDYNSIGDFFVEACVIPHMWHIAQGGRYARQAGQHFNPHTYIDIPTIATHRHFAGNQWNNDDRAKSNDLGGGHAHSGLMCYLGGLWPKQYHHQMLMGNLHGHRLNVDRIDLDMYGGYSAHRSPDFLLSRDRQCIIVAIHATPDGNAMFCDWSDKQVCHRNEVEIWDRTNGRLFKIVHKDTKPLKGLDLNKCTDAELVEHQTNENDWYARHARRLLHERHSAGTLFSTAETREQLADIAFRHKSDVFRLRAVWALHQVGGLTDEMSAKLLARTDGPLAKWAIQFGADAVPMPAPVRAALLNKDRYVSGPFASLYRAACLHAVTRLPLEDRWAALKAYNSTASTSNPTLDALKWYAVEPLAARDIGRVALLLNQEGFTLAVRRVLAEDTPKTLAVLLSMNDPKGPNRGGYPYFAPYVVPALNAGLQGRGRVAPPPEWPAVREYFAKIPIAGGIQQANFRDELLRLGLRFGDESALTALRETVLDAANPVDRRKLALESLQDAKDPNLPAVMRKLLTDDDLRGAAIRGLAGYDDPATITALLKAYPKLTAAEKKAVVDTLASRVSFAAGLLDAIEAKTIPAADVPAETIRQLRNLGVQKIDDRIAAVWGTVRATPADRKKLIAAWTAKLNQPLPVDVPHGRAVYQKVCAECHTLYGTGGKVGPEITGANRGDLGYLLENILDPSAVIPKEYAATKLNLADGRVVTGIVKASTATTLTVATATETLSIPVADVEKRTPSDLSMMPDDLTKTLGEADVRDLIAYLRTPTQQPMLATAETAKEFFNGKDLAGWAGDPAVFSVENGEIVGRTKTGLKRNAFLVNQLDARDFKLTLDVKLTPDGANSGIQFRSVPLADGEMRGPQADAGAGWWGKLYEESGRGLLWKESGEKHVKVNEWNTYVVEAVGPKVRTWINGQLCVDLEDAKLSRAGQIGLQVHSGGPMEVRFRNLKLEVK